MSRALWWLAAVIVTSAAEAVPLAPHEADRLRIQAHLRQVEAELLASDVTRLDPERRAERQRNIERLRRYREQGEFPRNSGHPGERVPYFIDRDGRACAVGALMIESGAGELASTIAKRENNARLFDMKTEGIGDWVDQSGLTATECARIQPAYCGWDASGHCSPGEGPVCSTSGNTYQCLGVMVDCSEDTYAYDGECVDGGPPDGGPVVALGESGASCAVGRDDRRSSLPLVLTAASLALLAVRRRASCVPLKMRTTSRPWR